MQKGPPYLHICGIWRGMLSSLIMLSLLSFPELSVHWYHKEWPHWTNRKWALFDMFGFCARVCVCVERYYPVQSRFVPFTVRAWYDKAWCLWKPRAFHNTALLNMVAVSQSPWQCTGSVTELLVEQNLIFSGATVKKNWICVVFFFLFSPLKVDLSGESFRDLGYQHTRHQS